jgi:CBS domain containing-hemolysin-like protein
MIGVLLLAAIGIAYYISYLLSLTAGGLYISDYEENRFIDSLPEHKREYLLYLLKNPKRVATTAAVVQSAALILSTVCWLALAKQLKLPMIHQYTLQVVLVLIGWFIYLSLIEVFAPNVKQEKALEIVQSRWWLLRLIMWLNAPLVSFLISQKERIVDRKDLEEKKEEIVERAIESLADSAGIDEPLLEQDVKRMIGNIFDLADCEVREVMVPRIEMVALEKGASLAAVQKLLTDTGHSRYPVYEEDIDNIRGVLYVKDLFQKFPLTDTGADLTTFARPAYFVPESKKLDALLDEFRSQKIHIAIVVDEYGGTAGLITLEDLLEKIVGDIQDEHDFEEVDVVPVSANEYIVSANLSMDDLSEKLGLKLEEKDFETVGGYIYDLVGSLPRVGQKVSVNGIDYVVEKAKGQRIDKVRITIHHIEKT